MKKFKRYAIPALLVVLGIIGFFRSQNDHTKDQEKGNGQTYIEKSSDVENDTSDETAEVDSDVTENQDEEEGEYVDVDPVTITEKDATPESEAYDLVITDMDEDLASQIERYDAFVSTIKAFLYKGGATKDNVTVKSLNNMQMDADGNKIYTMGIPEYGNVTFEIEYLADEDLYEIEF